jgi:hypothetical protein
MFWQISDEYRQKGICMPMKFTFAHDNNNGDPNGNWMEILPVSKNDESK